MGYIRFEASQRTDRSGRVQYALIKRVETDLNTERYDLNRIFHTISAPSETVQMWMVLDSGVLDRDKLKGREYMVLDSGVLEVDYIL